MLAQSKSWMSERAVHPVEANRRARRTASAVRWALVSAVSFLTSMRTFAAGYGRTAASTASRRATGSPPQVIVATWATVSVRTERSR